MWSRFNTQFLEIIVLIIHEAREDPNSKITDS